MKTKALLAILLLVAGAAFGEAQYGDVKFERRAQGMDDVPPAVFPHWVHRFGYKCGACHDELFKMKAGEAKITMEGIQARKDCGACHDGKAAFESNFDTCPRCHYK